MTSESLCACGEEIVFLDPILCKICETPLCGRCMMLSDEEKCQMCVFKEKEKEIVNIKQPVMKYCDNGHLCTIENVRRCNDFKSHLICTECTVYTCDGCHKIFCTSTILYNHRKDICIDIWRCQNCEYYVSKKVAQLRCFCGQYQCWECVGLYKCLRYGKAYCTFHASLMLSKRKCGCCNHVYPLDDSGILRLFRVPVKDKHAVVKRMEVCSLCFTRIRTLIDCLTFKKMTPVIIETILQLVVKELQIEYYNN